MLQNIVTLHNGYVEIRVRTLKYSHIVKLDKEDFLRLDCKLRITNQGYAYLSKDCGKSLHSFVMGYDTTSKVHIDHLNGDTLDNRKSNLRICTASENAKNRHSFTRNNSGVVGIQYRENGKYKYYRVSLTDKNGHRYCKQFNINKLGKEKAFKFAQKHLKEKKMEFGYAII